MNFDFSSKTVLVTAAGKGTGRQIAIAFAKAGADVVITARSLDRLTNTATELDKLKANYIKLKIDVTSYDDCERAIQETISRFGKIDFLINNASGYLPGWDLRQFSVQDIDDEINSTYRGVVYMTKAAMDSMIKNPGSIVVNIASISGLANRESGSVVYSADKGAVIRFSERMHKNLSPYKVRVCCLAPDNISEEGSPEQGAVSQKDVAAAILMQCTGSDNAAAQTIILEPKTAKP